MTKHNARDLVDIPRISEWTGINAKTLSRWANDRGVLPCIEDRAKTGKRFDWSQIRDKVEELSREHGDRIDPKKWPK